MFRFREPLRALLAAVLLAGFIFAAAVPAGAKTRALVVGINDYKSEKDLKGAVNDARDIAGGLRFLGVTDVVLLENGAARRDAIVATWDRMVAESGNGDVLVFSYAGHGASEPARRPDTPNGRSTALVLGGFDTVAPDLGERLTDDTLDKMFAKAEQKKKILVLVIVDACYSGGLLTRGIDPRAEALPDRSTPSYDEFLGNDPLPPPDPQTPPAKAKHENRLFFSSSDFDRTTPEVMIDGQPRGALSWAFARALRGEADREHRGVLTKGVLAEYVIEAVRQRAEWRQTPHVDPPGQDDRVVFALPRASPGPAVAPLPVRLLGVSAAEATRLSAALHDITPVETGADLTWDAATEDIISGVGDRVAQHIPADPSRLQAVIDKWRLLHWLDGRGAGSGLDIALSPGEQRHRAGTVITLTVSGMRQPAFLLFNIAADGTVQKLYPMPDEPPTRPAGVPYVVQTRVRTPFGADHVVAITSPAPLRELQQFLDRYDGRPAAAGLWPVLENSLRQNDAVQLAVHGLYTGP